MRIANDVFGVNAVRNRMQHRLLSKSAGHEPTGIVAERLPSMVVMPFRCLSGDRSGGDGGVPPGLRPPGL